ncbi:MAG: O-antigen ligase family protein [bacterium]
MNQQRYIHLPQDYYDSRLMLTEVLFYVVILLLPFENLFTIMGASIIKLAALVFLPFSFVHWGTFYGKVPRAILMLLGYVFIGIAVDIASGAFSDNLMIIAGPFFMWWMVLVSYNLACCGRLNRFAGIFCMTSIVLMGFQMFSIESKSTRVIEGVIAGVAGERISALETDPNGLAIFASLGFIYCLARGLNLLKTKLGYRLIFLFVAILCFFAILKTGSRGGLLAVLISIVSLIFTRSGTGKIIFSGVIVACVIFVMGFAIVRDDFFMARIQSRVENQEGFAGSSVMESVDTAGRFEIWNVTLGLIANSPIYGYGAQTQIFVLGKAIYGAGRIRVTHNQLLTVLLGSGLSGFICYLYFYICAFKSVWICRTKEINIILFLWFVLMFVGGMSLSMDSWKPYWIVAALALAAKDSDVRLSRKIFEKGAEVGKSY